MKSGTISQESKRNSKECHWTLSDFQRSRRISEVLWESSMGWLLEVVARHWLKDEGPRKQYYNHVTLNSDQSAVSPAGNWGLLCKWVMANNDLFILENDEVIVLFLSIFRGFSVQLLWSYVWNSNHSNFQFLKNNNLRSSTFKIQMTLERSFQEWYRFLSKTHPAVTS